MKGRLLVTLVVAAALFLAVAASPALAGKPGGGGGKPGGSATSGSLVVTPNPVPAWGATYNVSGSGFKAGSWVAFSTTCAGSFNRWPDANGNVSFTRTSGYPGTCRYDAFQGGSLRATVTFSIVE